MSKFDEFGAAVLKGSKDLARQVLGGFEDDAKTDAQAFLDKTEANLRKWTKMLAALELTKQDFEDLVQAQAALAEIHALTQAGVALTRLDQFRTGLINLVIDSAFDVFL